MLQGALRVRPEQPEVQGLLAACYLELGDADRAESICRRALRDTPAAISLQRTLADALIRQGRGAEAAAVLTALIQTQPNDESALTTLAQVHLELGRHDQARAGFEAILRAAPESTAALTGMAETLAAAGDISAAHGYVLRALAAAPDRVALQTLLARIAHARGDLVTAERAAAHAVALDPESTDALRMGVAAALELRHFGRAAQFAERLRDQGLDEPAAVSAMAFQAILDKRVEAALADLAPHLEAAPEDATLHLAAGCAHLAKRRAEAAVAHLIEVVRLQDDHPWAQRALGLAYEYGRRPSMDVTRAIETLLRTGDLGDLEGFVGEGDDTTDILEPIGEHSAPVPTPHHNTAPPPLVEAAVNRVLNTHPTSPEMTPVNLPATATIEIPQIVVVEQPPPTDVKRARALLTLLSSDRMLAPLARSIEDLVELDDTPLVLSVVGATSCGKTTFVNALLGDSLIPSGTKVPYLLRYGRRASARVVYLNGDIKTVTVAALKQRHEAGRVSPEEVARVELFVPIEELRRVRILDVPASADSSILLGSDAMIWLGTIDQAVQGWTHAAEWLDRRPITTLAVCTQADRVDAETAKSAIATVRKTLGARVVDVVSVSAQRGLAALRAGDPAGVRASGLARLHQSLARHLLDQAGTLRGATLRRQSRLVAKAGKRMIEKRIAEAQVRADEVQAEADRIEQDRSMLLRFAETDLALRITTGTHDALMGCGTELEAIRREGADHFTRLHQLDALRARIRRAIARVVDEVRGVADAEIVSLLDRYGSRLEKLLTVEGRSAPRVGALHGILDAYRMVTLESVFGRHRAYLEGWVDQAPLEVLLDDDGALGEQSAGSVADMVEELRTRGLRLGNARSIRMENFGAILFEALGGFIEETAAELRVTRVELTQRLIEPFERFLAG